MFLMNGCSMTIFEYLDKHITINLDKKFAKKVYSFTRHYLLSDKSISEFYGSSFFGVHPITFKSALEYKFYSDIIKVDKRDLIKDRKKVKKIIPSRKITGDIFNIILFYLARRIELENKLPKKILFQCQKDLVRLFCYRSLSALQNKYFSKYLIPSSMGTRVSDAMSDLFILKRLGNWHDYIEYRVDKVYDPERKEHKRLLSTNEDDFLSVLVKTQGGIRSTVKAIYKVYLEIKDSDKNETSRSLSVEIGDDTDIADLTTDVPATINRTLSKITSRDVFINKKVINLICSRYITRFKSKDFTQLLEDMYKTFTKPEGIKLMNYFRDILAYELHIIQENLNASQKNDPDYVTRWVRGVITSSRSRNELLLKLRDDGSKIISNISTTKNTHFVVKARMALMLYLLLLTF